MRQLIAENAPAAELGAWRRHLRLCDRCATAAARLRAGMEGTAESLAEAGPTASTAKLATGWTLQAGMGSSLEPNLQIGDFRIERRLGSGGMGVVYQAVQVSLGRRVALKVLPLRGDTGVGFRLAEPLPAGSAVVERFRREAWAAARLRHPNIVTVFAEGMENNVCYFAMEMVEGRNLDQVIADLRRRASLPSLVPWDGIEDEPSAPSALTACKSEGQYFNEAARLVSEAAEALHYAHGHGIIHRDVKPANLMLSRDGRLILLDFGVARICEERAMTLTGAFVGTPRYMSPEQLAGGPDKPDHRSDIYSLGVTLYELLTLEPLFDGEAQPQVISKILNEDIRHPRQVNPHIPLDLDTICYKAIEKNVNHRYQSAAELAEDLRRYLSGRTIKARRPGLANHLVKLIRRQKAVTALVCLVIALGTVATAIAWRHYTTQWAQRDAMAEIDRLIEQDQYLPAFVLAEKAERYIPDSPLLLDRWPRLSRRYSLTTKPSGVDIYVREYSETSRGWKYLGRSPLHDARVPFGTYRWRLTRRGYITLETVRSNDLPSQDTDRAGLLPQEMTFTLHEKGSFPDDMAWIPPSDFSQRQMFHGDREIAAAPAFLIDKYETTNRQFKEFVDAGGYEREDFWQEPFLKDGMALLRPQAMELFRDQTGRPGPATWANGTYPPDQRDYPVGGISWYEAAAYARFRDKDLPTVFHWAQAARADSIPSRITDLSNFGDGLAPVGTFKGMGEFGLYDAAGNVREWCYNTLEGDDNTRCILGGAWNENSYVFAGAAARSPWDRDPRNGVRCASYPYGREAVPKIAFAPVPHKHRDFSRFTPVPDNVFQSYVDSWYRYDPIELNARLEFADEDLSYCLRERITFDAAYPNERVVAYVHLPHGVKPPYQTILWFPGGDAREHCWSDKVYCHELVCILRSGRAVVIPFYKGTYDRRLVDRDDYPPHTIMSRNLYVQRSQDLRRTVDYLATRDDVDMDRLGFVGLSWGAQMGSLMIALEPRFKTGILLVGGICACERHPASDPANFAPRVKIPMLMINGQEDSTFPYETAQKPLFDLLGTPPEHKKHVLLPGEHSIPWEYRRQYHEEILNWLDKYLGKVEEN